MLQAHAARPRARSIPVMFVEAILALIGAMLVVGGAWLALLVGSIYYLLAGLGLSAAGILLIRGRATGVWIYFAV